jgi:hypothetical protein
MVINQNIDTQLYMHVKNHHHHMNYLKLDWSKCYLQNVALQKSQSPWDFAYSHQSSLEDVH